MTVVVVLTNVVVVLMDKDGRGGVDGRGCVRTVW